MIARLADRKRFCIWAFLLSVVPLALIPLLCKPGLLPSPTWSLATLILLWCVYQLLQYLAAVAFWSWLADAAQGGSRGRFLGWQFCFAQSHFVRSQAHPFHLLGDLVGFDKLAQYKIIEFSIYRLWKKSRDFLFRHSGL